MTNKSSKFIVDTTLFNIGDLIELTNTKRLGIVVGFEQYFPYDYYVWLIEEECKAKFNRKVMKFCAR